VFLAFAYSMCLFTDLYWLIYDFMRPDQRMPFAVNEIGEAALFLLLAAAVGSAAPHWVHSSRKQAVGAVLFAACNVALWIGWSGEWIQDIVIGVTFAYFLYNNACSLNNQQILKNIEWILLGIVCVLLVIVQGFTFFVEVPMYQVLDTGAYILLLIVTAYWVMKLIKARKMKAAPEALVSLSFSLQGWIFSAKYMSTGTWYLVFLVAETAALVFLYLSVRKVVADT